MRKGGPALLRAHQRLRQQGLPVETTVVSALQWTPDDYVGPSSEDYVRSETERLAQEGVTHHARLPNEAVLRLMDEADFLVLPTLHDTFGFVTIEALAGGTPVIGTDTCALPEIVEDKSCGYLLPLENEPQLGKWSWLGRRDDPDYLAAYRQAIASIAESMAETLVAFWESGTDYEALSAGALERVRSRFAKHIARDRYETLYELCRDRGHHAARRGW